MKIISPETKQLLIDSELSFEINYHGKITFETQLNAYKWLKDCWRNGMETASIRDDLLGGSIVNLTYDCGTVVSVTLQPPKQPENLSESINFLHDMFFGEED